MESLRWIIFDNQKVNGFLGPYRFLKNFAKPAGDPAVVGFLKGRIDNALAIVNKRLTGRDFLVSDKPTIADISMTAYLYYPAEEFGFDIAKEHPAIGAWLKRMEALPGWAHPYDIMPGYPFGTQGFRNKELVMAGHSRSKNGVSSKRLCPGHPRLSSSPRRECPAQGRA